MTTTSPDNPQRNRAAGRFLVISISFGLLFSVLTPPYQAPDEAAHFFRAWSIAEGQRFIQHRNGQSGAMLPASLLASKNAFEHLVADESQTTTRSALLEELRRETDESRRIFTDLSATAHYSPVAHAVHAGGIALVRIFDSPVLAGLYAARGANVLVSSLLIALAIRLLPFFGWGMAFIALLPMTVFLRGSASGDPVATALAFLVFALILHLAWSGQGISARAVAALLFATWLLAMTKPVYWPIVLLALMISRNRWQSNRAIAGFYIALGASLACGAALYLAWTSTGTMLTASTSSALSLPAAIDPGQQLAHVIARPLVVLRMILTDYAMNADRYLAHFIGRLGWLDTPLPTALLGAYALALLFIAVTGGPPRASIPGRHRLLAAMVLVLTISAISLSMYLVWTPVGASVVEGVQGRYFIPVAPVALLIVANRRFAWKGWEARWMPAAFAAFCVVGLGITCWVLVLRYYA